MTTVGPKLLKLDSVPFKSLYPARGDWYSSALFARALKEADSSKAAIQQAAEVADKSGQVGGQTEESGASAGLFEAGDDSVVNGNGSARPGYLESAANKAGDSSEAPAAISVNIADIAPLLAGVVGTPTAPDGISSADDARTTEVVNVLASGANAKAFELAQAAALWVNGGLKDGSAEATSANLLSTSQGSTISGVMDPAVFAAPGGGVGSALAGGPIGLSGAPAALQVAGQSAATNALLNSGRLEARLFGVGATGPQAASITNPGAVNVASALAAASVVRSAQSSALSDSAGLSTTAGSITGTLSVPVMSGSAGADLGGDALGTQTGGAGSESGGSSGGSRSGGSNAFTVQPSNPSEPNAIASLSGAANASASSARSVDWGIDTNLTTNAASVVDVAANQSPALDVNAPATQASVAADPRAAWRDLRSKWDQPIRANAPKG